VSWSGISVTRGVVMMHGSVSALASSALGREIWMPALLTSTSMPPSAAAASPDLLLGLVRLLGLPEVVDRDVGAMLGEAHGDRLADPRAAAGDQHVLALQARHALTAAGGR
jgi:hypothetical protein